GIIGTAVATALLPTLSRQVRGGQAGEALTTLNRAIEYALLLTLPAALALGAAAHPIVGTLFGRGRFDGEDVRLTTQALAAYASGLPAFVLVKVLVPAFFARGDTATPVKTGMASVALNLALNLCLMGPLQHLGPPIASSVSSWFNVAALAAILHRRGQFVLDIAIRRRVPRMLAASLAMAALLGVLQLYVLPVLDRFALPGAGLTKLALLVGGGLLAYAAAAQLFGAFDVAEIARRLLRRRREGVAVG
ncbi:MAG: polysaccharide biosynthesis C-terminal domain-containing protein, partial [Acidisphaera sp.]|nr:polysaccharide biosynthesis C-terminal domain-containing protein [Acidisphaera sp.]